MSESPKSVTPLAKSLRPWDEPDWLNVICIPYAAWTCAIQGAMIPYAQVEPEPSISAYSLEAPAGEVANRVTTPRAMAAARSAAGRKRRGFTWIPRWGGTERQR